MSELFEIPETLSPRLAWMKRHGIETMDDAFDAYIGENRWIAYLATDLGFNEYGDTEHDALTGLAVKLGIHLWNESGVVL